MTILDKITPNAATAANQVLEIAAINAAAGGPDVPSIDSAVNTKSRDVDGNKEDTVAGTSLVSLLKQVKTSLVTALANLATLIARTPADQVSVPSQDSASDVYQHQVIGKKSDTAAGTSIMAKVKKAIADIATAIADIAGVETKVDTSITDIAAVDAAVAVVDGKVVDVEAKVDTIDGIVDHTLQYVEHIESFTGNIWYADGSKSDDTGDGKTPETAKKTIMAAVALMSPGDAVATRGLDYDENVVLSGAGYEFWPEIGTHLNPATGIPLTLSGNSVKSWCPGGVLRITSPEDEPGVLITGLYVYPSDIRVNSGALGSIGFDIGETGTTKGSGAVLANCRCRDPKIAAFKVQGDRVQLKDCDTGGAVADSIGFWFTNSCDKPKIIECGSQGHSGGGFVADSGITKGVARHCSSGNGDGPRLDPDHAVVWSNYTFDNLVAKDVEFTDATQAFDLFKITGIVKISSLYGYVTSGLNAEFGNCKFQIHNDDGGGSDDNLTTATAASSLVAGSYVGKISDASDPLIVKNANAVGIVENTDWKEPNVVTGIIPKNAGNTTIQFHSSDLAGNKGGEIEFHVEWEPVSDGSFVEPA